LKRSSPSSRLRGALVAVALTVAGASVTHARRGDAQTPPAAADTYAIQLQRPVSVGDRARLVLEGEKGVVTRIVANGRPPTERVESLQVHFRAVERVLAITPNGRARDSEFTLERLDTNDATGAHVLLRPGQVVTVARAEHGRDARITLAGQPVDRPVREALGAVLGLGLGSSNDDLFGTTQRQAIGSAWPVQSEVAQRELLRTAQVTVTVTGQMRLRGRAMVQRTPCLDLSAEMNGSITAMAGLPPGSSMRSGTMHATMQGMLPVTLTEPARTRGWEMTIELVVDLPPNAASAHNELHLTMRESKSGTITPLAADAR
jgi:hypothetical protein